MGKILFYIFAILFILINISIFLFFDLTNYYPRSTDNMYNPKEHRGGALETAIDEDGFYFYFAIKKYYFNKNLFLPTENIIDLKVLDRLTFLKNNVKIKDYDYLIGKKKEKFLLNMKSEEVIYHPKIRHPSSRKKVGNKIKFHFIKMPATISTNVYFFLGENFAFFIPESIIIRMEGID